MNRKLKAKWVKALRSGKYQQTQGELRNSDGFCCLGVLRDIVHPRSTLEHTDEFILHPKHEKEFGIDGETQRRLAELNDGSESKHIRPHSFSEIADYIEKNL